MNYKVLLAALEECPKSSFLNLPPFTQRQINSRKGPYGDNFWLDKKEDQYISLGTTGPPTRGVRTVLGPKIAKHFEISQDDFAIVTRPAALDVTEICIFRKTAGTVQNVKAASSSRSFADPEKHNEKRVLSKLDKETIPYIEDGLAVCMPAVWGEGSEIDLLQQRGYPASRVLGVEINPVVHRELVLAANGSVRIVQGDIKDVLKTEGEDNLFSYVHLDYCGAFTKGASEAIINLKKRLTKVARVRVTFDTQNRNAAERFPLYEEHCEGAFKWLSRSWADRPLDKYWVEKAQAMGLTREPVFCAFLSLLWHEKRKVIDVKIHNYRDNTYSMQTAWFDTIFTAANDPELDIMKFMTRWK